jgi:hypothetical protein
MILLALGLVVYPAAWVAVILLLAIGESIARGK